MKFASERYFILLILIPLVAALIKLALKRKRAAFTEFASPETWQTIAPLARFESSKRVTWLTMVAVLFMTLALMRPQWGVDTETVKTTGMDIVFALDISRSMNVEDIAPNRLKKAKHLVRSIVESLGGDRVALVSFAGVADLTVPLTTDFDYFFNRLDSAEPDDAMIQGTDIGAALSLARSALDQGGETQNGAASRAVILISDAEDNEGEASVEVRKLEPAAIRFFAIGVGSDTGGPVPMRDDSGSLSAYKRDSQGKPVISKPDFKLLEKLASTTQGKSFRATATETEAEAIAEDLKGMKRGELAAKEIQIYHERFQWPLFFGILSLILATVFSWLRSPSSSKGAMLALWLSAAILSAAPSTAQAESSIGGYRKNKSGMSAFEKGDVEAAKKNFEEAITAEPNRAEHLYNEGTAELFSKDPAAAGQAPQQPGSQPGAAPGIPPLPQNPPTQTLPAQPQGDEEPKPAESADHAIEKLEAAAERASRDNPDLEARARYNLGTAYEKKGDIDGALKNYVDAIEASKRANKPDIEKLARKNIEILASKPKQQQNKNSDQNKDKKDQDKQSKNSKNSKNSNSESSKTDDQKQKQQQQQNKRYEKGKFQSQKISPEDANRVMSELLNKEHEVNARLRKKKEGVKRMMKDW